MARQFVAWAKDIQTIPLARVERYVEAYDIEGLIADINTKPKAFVDSLTLVVLDAGAMAADHLKGKGPFSKAEKPLRRSPTFSITRGQAAEKLRTQTTRLLERIEAEQRQVITETIAKGVEAGKKPRDIARQIKDNLPLTSKQERAVANYEWSLRTNTKESLNRALRDKRFDRLADGRMLTEDQIENMVAGYRRKMIAHRARNIATTEAHAAINWARDETARQNADGADVQRTWISRRDSKVRDTHDAIDGQKRGLDEPFKSPSGDELMTPGDTSLGAGAAEVVNCRCFVDYSVN